jgi:LPS sulfotransferase NodH
VFGRRACFLKACGFKYFYFHPYDGDETEVHPYLKSLPNFYIIHLKRRNKLRTMVSELIARRNRIWHTREAEGLRAVDEKRVVVDPEQATIDFERIQKYEDWAEEYFESVPMITLYYEDLVADVQGTFSKICELFEVREAPIKTYLLRQNPEPLQDLVINYDTLVAYLRRTKWESSVEE